MAGASGRYLNVPPLPHEASGDDVGQTFRSQSFDRIVTGSADA